MLHLGCQYKTYRCITVVGTVRYKHPTILLLQCRIAINCLASANQLWHYSFSKITNFETKYGSKWSKGWLNPDCDQGNSDIHWMNWLIFLKHFFSNSKQSSLRSHRGDVKDTHNRQNVSSHSRILSAGTEARCGDILSSPSGRHSYRFVIDECFPLSFERIFTVL